jgi:serine/threonine-protein kinase SRPK3
MYSPAGGHLCFATDVLGPDMRTLRSTQPNQIFPVSIAKRIIKQILHSVDYLHRECGYIHTGNSLCFGSFSSTSSTKKSRLDIKADNVLTVLPELIIPKIDKHLEELQSATYDNIKPSSQIVKSQPLSDFNFDLHHLRVKLIDYSEGEI